MEKGDNYENKQFGGIIKIESNGGLQITNFKWPKGATMLQVLDSLQNIRFL